MLIDKEGVTTLDRDDLDVLLQHGLIPGCFRRMTEEELAAKAARLELLGRGD